jgi:hypothetical protein
MTLDLLRELLQAHLAALESPMWPRPHGVSSGPALYLDAAETRALIARAAAPNDATGPTDGPTAPPADGRTSRANVRGRVLPPPSPAT